MNQLWVIILLFVPEVTSLTTSCTLIFTGKNGIPVSADIVQFPCTEEFPIVNKSCFLPAQATQVKCQRFSDLRFQRDRKTSFVQTTWQGPKDASIASLRNYAIFMYEGTFPFICLRLDMTSHPKAIIDMDTVFSLSCDFEKPIHVEQVSIISLPFTSHDRQCAISVVQCTPTDGHPHTTRSSDPLPNVQDEEDSSSKPFIKPNFTVAIITVVVLVILTAVVTIIFVLFRRNHFTSKNLKKSIISSDSYEFANFIDSSGCPEQSKTPNDITSESLKLNICPVHGRGSLRKQTDTNEEEIRTEILRINGFVPLQKTHEDLNQLSN